MCEGWCGLCVRDGVECVGVPVFVLSVGKHNEPVV